MDRYKNCSGRRDMRGLVLTLLAEKMKGQTWFKDEVRGLIEGISHELDCEPMNVSTALLCLDILGELTIERDEFKDHYKHAFADGDMYGIVDDKEKATEVDDFLALTDAVDATAHVVLAPATVEWMYAAVTQSLEAETRLLRDDTAQLEILANREGASVNATSPLSALLPQLDEI